MTKVDLILTKYLQYNIFDNRVSRVGGACGSVGRAWRRGCRALWLVRYGQARLSAHWSLLHSSIHSHQLSDISLSHVHYCVKIKSKVPLSIICFKLVM